MYSCCTFILQRKHIKTKTIILADWWCYDENSMYGSV